MVITRWQQGAVVEEREVSEAKDFPEISTLPGVIQVLTQIIIIRKTIKAIGMIS